MRNYRTGLFKVAHFAHGLGLNADYDRIQELANQHRTIPEMLGHGVLDEDETYGLQTIKDNLTLLTPEILDRINQEVVRAGHGLVEQSPDEGISGRCDSFVVEIDVHFPTDINLLYDAVRLMIRLCAVLCQQEQASRQKERPKRSLIPQPKDGTRRKGLSKNRQE